MNAPCVLTVASLSPYYLEGLQAMGVEVLDRLHERDPEAFARQAHRIRAVAAASSSKDFSTSPGSALQLVLPNLQPDHG